MAGHTKARVTAAPSDSDFGYTSADVGPLPKAVRDRPGVNLEMTVTRREHQFLPLDGSGTKSLGQHIDSMFADIAKEGGCVADFSLELTEETFKALYPSEKQARPVAELSRGFD